MVSGWPPGGEALNVEPVAGRLPGWVILPPTPPTDCQMPCDEDCEIGPVHCWNWHRPNHKPDWHDPAECDRTAT